MATSFPTSPPSLPVSQVSNNWLATWTAGTTLTAVPGFNNQLAANTSGVTLVGGNGDDTFVAYDPNTVIVAGSGVDTVLTWGSGYTLPAGIANLTLEGSGNAFATGNSGNNIITANGGTDILTTGGGNDILIAGTGIDTFVPTQQANTTTWIEGFNASLDKIDLSAYGFTSFAAVQAAMAQSGSNVGINLGNGQLLMLQNQSVSNLTASNVILPSSSSTSSAAPTFPSAPPSLPVSGASNNWLATWTPGTTLTGVAGFNNQLAANTTNVTLVGANGDDTFVAFDPNTVISGGGGTDTVETWGSGYTLPAGVANLTLEGSGNAFATGNSGNNIITGNGGTDILTTGGGNDILIAGTGLDTFVPTQQANTTTWIEGFNPSLDKIDLSAYGFSSFSALQAAMTQSGSNVGINLGNGQLLMLQNQPLSNVMASNVILSPSSTGATSTGTTSTGTTSTGTTSTGTTSTGTPSTGSTSSGNPVNPAGMTMTFDDEFNSLSLNMGTASTAGGTWDTYFMGWGVRGLSGNGEQETYVDPAYTAGDPVPLNPFSNQNGVLTITASPTPTQDLPYVNNMPYVSGTLNTQTSFSQTYGYFEMRAQLPGGGQGLWPAFWLLPENNSWPPEIDVFEQVSNPSSNIFTTIHDNITGNSSSNFNIGNTSAGYHTYGVLWTSQDITFYVDGQKAFSTPTPPDYNQPMYMLMNLAVGGGWPGSPNSSTNWSQANMNVDYVRAYSLSNTAMAAPATISTSGGTVTGSSGGTTTTSSGGTTTTGSSGGTTTTSSGGTTTTGSSGGTTTTSSGGTTTTGSSGGTTTTSSGGTTTTGSSGGTTTTSSGGTTTTGSSGGTTITPSPGPTFPSAPPSLPVSQVSNNWLATWTPGTTLTAVPGFNNQLAANTTNVTLVGSSGDDTFVAFDPNTVISGGGGTDTVETWGSGYTLPAGVANLTLEGSGNAFATGNSGNNIITANGGTDILTTGGGNDILIAGTGIDTFVPTQQANTTTWIEGFNASLDKIDLSAYGFTSFAAVQAAMAQSGSNVGINLGNGQLLMLQNQSVSNLTASNVILPSSSSTSSAAPTFPSAPPSLPVSGASNNWLATWTPGTTLTGVAGFNNQLAANTTNVTLVGANGDDTFVAFDPNTVISGGGGTDTVETWGSGYTLPAGVANLTLEGSGNAFATGNSGNNIITGNGGTDILTTGGGNDILIAGTGLDTFVPTQQANTTTWIEGFNPSLDKIDLSAYGFSSFSALQAAMTQSGSNVGINLGNGQLLMLQNQPLSNVMASNVILSPSSTGATSTGTTSTGTTSTGTTSTGTTSTGTPSTGSTSSGNPVNPAGMTMTFDDEFNSLSLNMGTASTAGGTWDTYFMGWGVRGLSGNGEQETYVDPAYTAGDPVPLNPFSNQNGVLTITASPTPTQDLPYVNNMPYVSGTLNTQTSFSQTYGYFEMRAQLPGGGQGLWPAFWLLPENNSWPPEIDVFEQVSNPSSNIFTTIHDNITGNSSSNFNIGNTSAGYHTYGVLWTSQDITFYVDGQKAFSTPTPPDYNQPMYMLMNLAVGGGWPGSPNSSTNWSQANMNVDYVRAYSLSNTAMAAPATISTSGGTVTGSSGGTTTTSSGGTTTTGSSGGTTTTSSGGTTTTGSSGGTTTTSSGGTTTTGSSGGTTTTSSGGTTTTGSSGGTTTTSSGGTTTTGSSGGTTTTSSGGTTTTGSTGGSTSGTVTTGSLAEPHAILSNANDPTNLSSSFSVPTLTPGTSATYTAGQLGISNVASGVTVTVADDLNNDLTVTNNGTWGGIKDVTINSPTNGDVNVNNFVDAQVSLGNGGSTVTASNMMRGTVTVGDGNSTISVNATSNSNKNDTTTINAGNGSDQISFTGASNTKAAINAGNLGNTITVGGQASATVKSGTGNDDFVDKSTGSLTLTGGGGSDIFEFVAGAHATVTDFQAGQDSIVLHGLTSSQVQVTDSRGNTFINLGNNSQVELAGVSLTANQIHMTYA